MRRLAVFCPLLLLVQVSIPQNAAVFRESFVALSSKESIDSILALAANVRPTARQIAWQEREFSLFIHFGMNTFTDREWGKRNESPTLFNPSEFDARQWARVARVAGARQIVIVAKHHDGFCLWPSRWTDYSVRRSPWKGGKGDVIAEVAEACRESELSMGIYLSPWDISSPLYGTDAYNTYFENQLQELLTGYGEIAEVWFDGASGEGPNGRRQVYDWGSYYALVRRLQPGAVIAIMGPDVRWVGTETGYGRESEWSVIPIFEEFTPPESLAREDLATRDRLRGARGLAWYPSEVDVSIRPGWFYHAAEDSQVKTPEQLVDIYYCSVGRNSHLLLNIPPDRRGKFCDQDVRSLLAMRRLLDTTFSRNLAARARVVGMPERGGDAITDDDPRTFWAPGMAADPSLVFDLGGETSFNRLQVQENVRNGQRVEEFVLEAGRSGVWEEVVRGTTAGYKRLLRFTRTTARYVRFRILRSRGSPEIATFGLYLAASGEP